MQMFILRFLRKTLKKLNDYINKQYLKPSLIFRGSFVDYRTVTEGVTSRRCINQPTHREVQGIPAPDSLSLVFECVKLCQFVLI